MLKKVELGRAMDREAFEAAVGPLRADLLAEHVALRGQKFSVIVLVSGADGAGKGELVHRLNEWLDPRGVETHAFWDVSDEERERPPFWRYWRAMPGRGRIGIFFGSWYTAPIIDRVFGRLKRSGFDAELDRIVAHEQMLAADGTLLVKLWLHLPKQAQKKRIRKLEAAGRDAPDDRKHYELYDRFTETSEHAIARTDSLVAPWHVIEATDRRHREFTAAVLLRDAIRARLRAADDAAAARRAAKGLGLTKVEAKSFSGRTGGRRGGSALARVDLRQRLSLPEYAKKLEKWQRKLSKLAWAAREKRQSMVLVFEGWDAAGKGSASRRVTQAMDPRLYHVVGFAAPSDEERAQHYLWRFWRQLPRAGYSTIFDRSWYGRLLVERVEGFATPAEWGRSYDEINAFEEHLTANGTVLCKFWLHISQTEQLRRFKERQTVSYKQYKITDEDWRNRKKWPEYERAVEDMVARCSTDGAPWTLVAGNDKLFARVQILETVVRRLDAVL